MTVNRKCVFDFCICIIMLSMTLVLTSALPLKDSCVVVGPEIPDFHVQGEAVIIKFPFLEDAIHYRKLQLDNSSTFHINHTNQRNHRSLKSCCDRVVQNGRGILLLPSHPSDSGIYTYVLSGDTYCLIGNISITIYESEEANITVMPYTAHTGENTRVICPHLKYFKRAENPKWYKDFQSTALTVGEGQYTIERGIILTIRNISVKDEGFYTCRLKVILNNIQYNVSRTWRVSVLEVSSPSPVISENPKVFTSSSYLFPYITFPVDGSFIKSHCGSRLEIQCKVFIGNQSAEFTDVTWMIGGTSVENSYLGKRVFQKEKRISANHIEVQLVILKLQKEDNGAELKCISQNQAKKQEVVTEIKLEDSESVWLVVAVAFSYFILVVFIFLYHLCQKPQKQQVYILAQQKSTI
ncbi:interleukin-1 receptor type 2 isoform X1 [Triplophysa rosa]|uniref:Interleukin-1 receptor 2 n=1 Tax=Triplophysa rosa TaxID=992332 RepID=A0A9W7WTP0_TRIRA|nr:interleukin-1 receptor type 2 isoform X1 [Triplophysa rosa]KAI7808307.1 interleukin-1 receptor 2 [Triplophysa rosa]